MYWIRKTTQSSKTETANKRKGAQMIRITLNTAARFSAQYFVKGRSLFAGMDTTSIIAKGADMFAVTRQAYAIDSINESYCPKSERQLTEIKQNTVSPRKATPLPHSNLQPLNWHTNETKPGGFGLMTA
jgi:hypothetical protein